MKAVRGTKKEEIQIPVKGLEGEYRSPEEVKQEMGMFEERQGLSESSNMTHLWLASMGRVPKLDQMDKEAIRRFMKKYEAYVAMVKERRESGPQEAPTLGGARDIGSHGI